jgi:endonuclease YncB( thermonuclease family)
MRILLIIITTGLLCNSAVYAEKRAEYLLDGLQYERTIDGDTFVASGRKIRLWGIDAPEKNDPASLASTLYLEVILKKGILTCKQIDVDRYRRDVMQCFVDGFDVASDLVRFGLAKDYKKYSGGFYSSEEAFAKKNKSGIWKK